MLEKSKVVLSNLGVKALKPVISSKTKYVNSKSRPCVNRYDKTITNYDIALFEYIKLTQRRARIKSAVVSKGCLLEENVSNLVMEPNMFQSAKKFVSDLNPVSGVKESFDSIKEEGVKMPDVTKAAGMFSASIDNAAEKLSASIASASASIKEAASNVKVGFDFDFSTFKGLFPSLEKPISMFTNFLPKDEKIRDAILVTLMTAVYLVVWSRNPSLKKKLATLAFISGVSVLCYSTFAKTFGASLVGLSVIKEIWDAFISKMDDEPVLEMEANSDLGTSFRFSSAMKLLISVLALIYTGVDMKLDFHSVMMKCSMMKKIYDGCDFTISMIFDVFREICDLIFSPFGITMFKKALGAFPELYDIGDYFTQLNSRFSSGDRIHRGDYADFQRKCEALYRTEKLVPHDASMNSYRSHISFLKQTVKTLEMSFASNGILHKGLKPVPYTFTLVGPSQIGKSTLMESISELMMPFILNSEDYDKYKINKEAYKCSVKPEDEFQEAYSNGVEFVTVDDIFQMKNTNKDPKICHGNWLIMAVNPQPKMVNKAFDKGRTFYEFSVAGFSTNAWQLNVDNLSVIEPDAVAQRLGDSFVVDIKPEYKIVSDDPSKYGLNKKLSTSFDPNIYLFRRYTFRRDHVGKFIPLEPGENKTYEWKDFIKFLVSRYVDHSALAALNLAKATSVTDCATVNPFFGMSRDEMIAFVTNPIVSETTEVDFEPLLEMEGNSKSEEVLMDDIFFKQLYEVDEVFCQEILSYVLGGISKSPDFAQNLAETGINTMKRIYCQPGLQMRCLLHMFKCIFKIISASSRRYVLTFREVFNILRKHSVSDSLSLGSHLVGLAVQQQWNDTKAFLKESLWTFACGYGFWSSLALALSVDLISSFIPIVEETLEANSILPPAKIRKKKDMIKSSAPVSRAITEETSYVLTSNAIPSVTKEEMIESNSLLFSEALMDVTESINLSNLFTLNYNDTNKTNILFLRGTTAIVNEHTIADLDLCYMRNPELEIHLIGSSGIKYSCLYRYCEVVKWKDKDLALVKFSPKIMMPKPDIVSKFISKGDLRDGDGKLDMILAYTHRPDTRRNIVMIPVKTWTENQNYMALGHNYGSNMICYNVSGVPSTCISPLWLADDRYKGIHKIVGLHSAGSTSNSVIKRGASHIVTKEILEAMLLDIADNTKLVIPMQVPMIGMSAIPSKFPIIEKRDPIKQCTFTKYKRTPYFEFLGPGTNAKIPSMLEEYSAKVGDEWVNFNPTTIALSKYCFDSPSINPDILDVSFSMFIRKWDSARSEHRSTPSVWSCNDAINGRGLVQPDSRQSSAGQRLQSRGITKYMMYGPEGPRDTNNSVISLLKSEVEEIYIDLKKGIVPTFINKGFLKSELLPNKSILSGKSRYISGAEWHQLILEKRLFGDLQDCALRHHTFNGFSSGMNPYSSDWDILANVFMDYENVFDGDQSKYDGRLKHYLFILFRRFCEHYYYNATEEECLAREALIYRLAHSMHLVTLDDCSVVIQFHDGLSSGCFITQLFGNFSNNIIGRYNYLMSWTKSVGLNHLSYDLTIHDKPKIYALEDNFMMVSLGDDHIIGIREVVFPFSAMIAQKNFDEMGFVYTSADKDSVIDYEFKTISECTYLQRSFVFDSTVRRYIAPINENSIKHSLYWSETNMRDFHLVINTALQEASLRGREYYKNFKRKLLDRSLLKGTPITSDYLNYDVTFKFVLNAAYTPWDDDVLEY